jgi:hypothetical protein
MWPGNRKAHVSLAFAHSLVANREASQIMDQMCRALVTANGFVVTSPADAAATVVCQYIKSEGAAVPEHWWIELAGGVVIQTVPGKPLEVGGTGTRFHRQGGRLAKDAPRYQEIRIPCAR